MMKNKNLQGLVTLSAAMVFLLVCVTTGTADLTKRPAGDGEQGIRLPVKKVTIAQKTLEAVITNIGDRYAVADETIITGMDGQQVDIRKMLVPCDVELTYETRKGRSVAQRIKIVRIGQNPSWHWVSETSD